MIKLALFAGLLIMLSGCAVMDTSVLDTAEPLQEGKVKLETFASTGLVLETAVYNEEDDEVDNPRYAAMWPVMGLKYGIGIADSAEVGIKGWAALGSIGCKAYYKLLLDRKDDVYYSMIPAFTYTGIDNDDAAHDDDEAPDSDHKYMSLGVELPVLVTRKFSENVSFTVAARMNYNYFKYQYVAEHGELIKHGPYNMVHGGVLCNAMFKLDFLYLTPEVGVEVVPVIDGCLTFLPNLGLSLGLRF